MCFRLVQWIFMTFFWPVCGKRPGTDAFVLWWCGVMQWHTLKTLMFVFINSCSSQKLFVKYLINIDLIRLSVRIYNPKLSHGLTCHFMLDGGKSPVDAYTRVEALHFFHVFKPILIVSLRRDEMLTWLIFHLFDNLSDNNWRQFL